MQQNVTGTPKPALEAKSAHREPLAGIKRNGREKSKGKRKEAARNGYERGWKVHFDPQLEQE